MSDPDYQMFVNLEVNDPAAFKPGENYTLDLVELECGDSHNESSPLLDNLESANLDDTTAPTTPEPGTSTGSALPTPPDWWTQQELITPEQAYNIDEELVKTNPELAELATKNYNYILKQGSKDSERLTRAIAYNMAVEELKLRQESKEVVERIKTKIKDDERTRAYTMPFQGITPFRTNVKKLDPSVIRRLHKTPDKRTTLAKDDTPSSVQSDPEITFRDFKKTSRSQLQTLGLALSGLISRENSADSQSSNK